MKDFLNKIICGDCVEEMAKMEVNSVDAIVTDPPYGLEFMGKEWDKLDGAGRDRSKSIQKSSFGKIMNAKYETPRIVRSKRRKCLDCGGYSGGYFKICNCKTPNWEVSNYPKMMQQWHMNWAKEALRVLKPGGHLLAFGGTRTYHRLVCALEDAGFDIRDTIVWLYGSGFSKNHDISKAIDKIKGAKRKFSHKNPANRPYNLTKGETSTGWQSPPRPDKTYSATSEAKQWEGWGTALKPAMEPICLARKPVEGAIANNVLKYGTGGLNIKDSRVEGITDSNPKIRNATYSGFDKSPQTQTNLSKVKTDGRYPANVILDEEAGEILDRQSGMLLGAGNRNGTLRNNATFFGSGRKPQIHMKYDSGGGASRFFYCAKASRSERNAGAGQNNHPTVKPIKLIKYLIKLITPPNGLVLDPFLGSGTTGVACKELCFNFIGIENEKEYIEIAEKRINNSFEIELSI